MVETRFEPRMPDFRHNAPNYYVILPQKMKPELKLPDQHVAKKYGI